MVSAINSALSGLAAAGKRLEVSANNIANQSSTKTRKDGQVVDTPFVPKQVQQVSLENGGVQSVISDVEPPSVELFSPSDPSANADGMVEFPNVDLEKEIVNQIIAGHDYKANLKTIKTQDDLLKSLLDIKS